jgi:hypothetical protein
MHTDDKGVQKYSVCDVFANKTKVNENINPLLSLALGIQMSRASLNALALVCKLNTR